MRPVSATVHCYVRSDVFRAGERRLVIVVCRGSRFVATVLVDVRISDKVPAARCWVRVEAVVGREGATLHSCSLEDELLQSETISRIWVLRPNLPTTSLENGGDPFGDVDVRDPS